MTAISDIRYVGRIPGRYTLPERKASSGLSVFACRTQGITPMNATVSAPVVGKVDDPISANFDDIGLIHGHIARLIDGGFSMDIDAKANDIDNLASRIEWIKKKATQGVPDSRSHKRVLPRNPHSTLVMSDGERVQCFVMDMSSSGAAISADYRPPLGTPLAIGKIVGRVTRRLEAGFAVQFLESQSLDEIEKLLIRQAEELH